jgi:hypothetical protein
LFAIIGVLSVAAKSWPTNGHSSSDAIVRFFPAPDGSMKAAIIFYVGRRGAISPSCDSAVSIVPSSASENDAKDEKFAVFTGGCDPFAVRDKVALSSPLVEWLSNANLKITSSINATIITPASVTMKKRDASNQIVVQFEAHE